MKNRERAPVRSADAARRRLGDAALVLSREAPLELGRFSIVGVLGRGGMGVVYEALDHERGQTVALKALHELDPEGLRRLKAEFRAVADVVHPNLVLLHELVCDGADWFFTMEYVPGEDLLRYVWGAERASSWRASARHDTTELHGAGRSEAGADQVSKLRRSDDAPESERVIDAPAPLGPEARLRLVRCAAQLASGIDALHRAGKLHRDLKPSNVRVTDDERVVILDFGLVTDPNSPGGELAHPHAGTPAYMAPEQALGRELSPSSDWYAFGAVLYEALSGHPPYRGTETLLTASKLAGSPLRPSQLQGGEPDELEELCIELLDPDPSLRPPGAEILARLRALRGASAPTHADEERSSGERLTQPPEPGGSPVLLVGRDAERGELERAIDDLVLGEAIVVTVAGRSGTGKTSLVRSVIDELGQSRSALVLEGRCYERESVPFKAFDQIVDELGRTVRSLPWVERAPLIPDSIQDLARMFPALADLAISGTASRSALALDPQALQRRAFRGLKHMLRGLAARKRLVVFIDDLQWSDRDSARLLAELLATDERPALLFVLAYRSEQAEEAQPVLDALSVLEAGVRSIELAPLDAAASELLARRQLEARGADASLAGRIARESGGSPFWVEQLAAFAAATGRLDVGLAELVTSRASALPEGTRRLLELVCIAGGPVEQELVQGAARLGDGGLAALLKLRAEGLVRTRGARRIHAVEPQHDRVREAVTDALSAERLCEHHLALAEHAERAGSGEPRFLALHFHAAGRREQALRYAVLAAEQAERGLAFEQAAALYELALECTEGAAPERLDLERRAGDALAAAGRGARAAAHYLSAAKLSSGVARTDLERAASEQLLTSGRLEEGVQRLRPLLEAAGLGYPPSAREAVASMAWHTARLELRRLRGLTQRRPSHGSEQLTRIDLAWSAGRGLLSFDPVRGAYYFVRALGLALEQGEPSRIARGLAIYGMLTTFGGGRFGERRGHAIIDQARTLAAELDDPLVDGTIEVCMGISLVNLGRVRDGLARLVAGRELLETRCVGVAWEQATAYSSTLNAWYWLGDFHSVARVSAELERQAQQRGDRYLELTGTSYLALTDLCRGRIAELRRRTDHALSLWSREGFHFQHWLALKLHVLADLYEGKHTQASSRLDARLSEAERSGVLGLLIMRVDAELLKGTVALATSRHAPAELERAARSAARLESLERPMASAVARLLRAGVALARGQHAEARSLHLVAARELDSLDLHALSACARLRAAELTPGERGQKARELSLSELASRGVADPRRFASVLAPSDEHHV